MSQSQNDARRLLLRTILIVGVTVIAGLIGTACHRAMGEAGALASNLVVGALTVAFWVYAIRLTRPASDPGREAEG